MTRDVGNVPGVVSPETSALTEDELQREDSEHPPPVAAGARRLGVLPSFGRDLGARWLELLGGGRLLVAPRLHDPACVLDDPQTLRYLDHVGRELLAALPVVQLPETSLYVGDGQEDAAALSFDKNERLVRPLLEAAAQVGINAADGDPLVV